MTSDLDSTDIAHTIIFQINPVLDCNWSYDKIDGACLFVQHTDMTFLGRNVTSHLMSPRLRGVKFVVGSV